MLQETVSVAVEVLSGSSNTLLLSASILIGVGVGVLDLPKRWLGCWLDIFSVTALPIFIRAALWQP